MPVFDALKANKSLADPLQFRINDKTYTVAEQNGGVITNEFLNEIMGMQTASKNSRLVMSEQLEALGNAEPGSFKDVDFRVVQTTFMAMIKAVNPEGVEEAAKN